MISAWWLLLIIPVSIGVAFVAGYIWFVLQFFKR